MWTPIRQFCSSRVTFLRWLIQLLRKGYGRSLDGDDVRSNPVNENTSTLHSRLFRHWKEASSKDVLGERRPLLWATLKSFQVVIILCATLRVFDTCFLLTLERVLLGEILQRLVSDPEDNEAATASLIQLTVIIFALLSLFRLALSSLYYYALEAVGRKLRIGLTSLFYDKLLNLSQKSLRDIGAGGVINLVSNDGAKLENSYEILTVFIGPLQLCSLTWIVWTHFGIASIAGLAAIVTLGLVQSYMGKIGTKYRAKVASASSHRVKLVTQIVTAIRTIKMYAWEVPFAKLVGDTRRKELELIRQSHLLRTIGWCFYSCTSTLAMFSTIIAYLSLGYSLTAEKVFVCTTIYQNIGMVLNIDFPKGIAQLGIFLITISRFQEFLLLEECQSPMEVNPVRNGLISKRKSGKMSLRNVTIDLCGNLVLENASLELKSTELIAVVGSVGAGKSTLFNAILREVPVSTGSLSINGRIAYAPQQAWLFRGTIRDNILFGNAYRRDRYDKVIHACALGQDLNAFPQGDDTLVAEGGVSLSGGQKARISLARAVYSDAEIYLLDDTLSAVDQKVGQHIVTYCINGLLKDKLRLLITHQLHLLPTGTRVLGIESGALKEILFDSTLAPHKITFRDCDEDLIEHQALRISNEKYFDDLNGNVPERTRGSDRVPINTYRKYFCASSKNLRYLTAFGVITIIAHACQTGENYFLKFSVTEGSSFRSWSYGAQLLAILSVIFTVLLTSNQHSSSFLKIIHLNSVRIYDSMFLSVLNAPIKFFTDNSAGYVIERFARDTFMLDEVFPFSIFYASHILQKYTASLLLFLASSFHSSMIIPLICLLYGVYLCQQFQIRSCRSLNRLEVEARESIATHLNSSFHGLTTIRAFGKQEKLRDQFRSFLDYYFWLNFTKLSVICLTSAAIDFMSLAIVNLFILITIFTSDSGSSLCYGIAPLVTLTHAIGWAASQFHVIESQAKSVESIFKISEVKGEGSDEGNERRPPADWPWKGKITFENVSLTHQPGRPVLKNINFTIYPGEKVGIIGRTGAGKSTLVSALFRLPEPTGDILIDGLSILNLPLRDLRPRISIIPQDPVLFEGTVRSNLDPFNDFSDNVLIDSLMNVNLGHFTQFGGLEIEIQDGGKNMSVGERQLLCMARALLRKNKILVLDEATANVDLQTSRLIQDKISEIFADCTVLTIQHRLTSILQYDKILVLDVGEILEFDTPETLLRNPGSYLSQRISQSGT